MKCWVRILIVSVVVGFILKYNHYYYYYYYHPYPALNNPNPKREVWMGRWSIWKDTLKNGTKKPNFSHFLQAFQSATRNAVGCLKRTDGGPSSSSCNTSDSHHPGSQNQQHPLQQRYHNGGGGPSTPGMPGSAGAIGKQPPISRPTPKSNQHENNNSSLNGTLY